MEIKCSTCNEKHEAHPLVDKTGYVTVCPQAGTCEVHNYGCYYYTYVKNFDGCTTCVSGVYVGSERDLKDFLLPEKSTSYYKIDFKYSSFEELKILLKEGVI